MPDKKNKNHNKKKNDKKKKALFALCLVCALTGTGCAADEMELIRSGESMASEAYSESGSADRTEETMAVHDTGEEAPSCVIHICGAVKQPGVYELPEGSRMQDAVEAAGGFAHDAARDALNLAAFVSDGVQIAVPTEEECENGGFAAGSVSGTAGAGAEADALVDINHADAAQLCTLPGIGESRAADIIAYREANGPFQTIEEIMNVGGIKEASFAKLKDKITVR